jgi:hypothetical protein
MFSPGWVSSAGMHAYIHASMRTYASHCACAVYPPSNVYSAYSVYSTRHLTYILHIPYIPAYSRIFRICAVYPPSCVYSAPSVYSRIFRIFLHIPHTSSWHSIIHRRASSSVILIRSPPPHPPPVPFSLLVAAGSWFFLCSFLFCGIFFSCSFDATSVPYLV